MEETKAHSKHLERAEYADMGHANVDMYQRKTEHLAS